MLLGALGPEFGFKEYAEAEKKQATVCLQPLQLWSPMSVLASGCWCEHDSQDVNFSIYSQIDRDWELAAYAADSPPGVNVAA